MMIRPDATLQVNENSKV